MGRAMEAAVDLAATAPEKRLAKGADGDAAEKKEKKEKKDKKEKKEKKEAKDAWSAEPQDTGNDEKAGMAVECASVASTKPGSEATSSANSKEVEDLREENRQLKDHN